MKNLTSTVLLLTLLGFSASAQAEGHFQEKDPREISIGSINFDQFSIYRHHFFVYVNGKAGTVYKAPFDRDWVLRRRNNAIEVLEVAAAHGLTLDEKKCGDDWIFSIHKGNVDPSIPLRVNITPWQQIGLFLDRDQGSILLTCIDTGSSDPDHLAETANLLNKKIRSLQAEGDLIRIDVGQPSTSLISAVE